LENARTCSRIGPPWLFWPRDHVNNQHDLLQRPFFITQAGLLRAQIKGSGELSNLGFYPVSRVVENMPIIDVTEFMLKQPIQFANAPSAMNLEPPIFSYRHNVTYIRYRASHKAAPHSAKEFELA